MNKKNLAGLIILAVLAGVAIYFATNKGKGTIKKELKDFAIADTAAITKMFLADKAGKTILLERNGNKWSLNKDYTPRQDAIDVLMETIAKVAVKAPVSKTKFESVVKNISGDGIKIEIYMGKDKPAKTYYVGRSNQDHTGTYMLLEGSSVPFLMHIEGHFGHLRSRYFTTVEDWKSTILFGYDYGDIAEIKVDYVNKSKNGFRIKAIDNNNFELYNSEGRKMEEYDITKLLGYVSSYKKIHFEEYEKTKEEGYADSLKTVSPEVIFDITDKNGQTMTVKTYKKPLSSGPVEYEGDTIELDVDRFHGIVNEKDFVVLQYYVFNPLMVDIGFFRKEVK